MTVYAVFREGVYRHECGGLFATLDEANEVAKNYASHDRDNHHAYAVVQFEVGKAGALRLGRYKHADSMDEPDSVAAFRKGDET